MTVLCYLQVLFSNLIQRKQEFTHSIQTMNVILHISFQFKVCNQMGQNDKINIYLCGGAYLYMIRVQL